MEERAGNGHVQYGYTDKVRAKGGVEYSRARSGLAREMVVAVEARDYDAFRKLDGSARCLQRGQRPTLGFCVCR